MKNKNVLNGNNIIMKYLAITMMLFSGINIFGQARSCNDIPKDISNQLDKMGVDDLSLLNSYESAYFNVVFNENLNGFYFHGKKIAFITESSGTCIISKTEFFNTCINPWLAEGETPQIFMVKLTEEEKNKSGGYDVLVLSWVKVFTDKRKKIIIKQLSKN